MCIVDVDSAAFRRSPEPRKQSTAMCRSRERRLPGNTDIASVMHPRWSMPHFAPLIDRSRVLPEDSTVSDSSQSEIILPIFDSAERPYIRRGEVDVDSARRAKALLDELRRTRMLRGGRISEHKQTLRSRISEAIARRAVLPRLAERVAFQLVLKVDTGGLGDRAVWLAIGDRLQKEIESLKSNLALVDRQIVVALPKLSADQVAALHDELQAADPAVARTVSTWRSTPRSPFRRPDAIWRRFTASSTTSARSTPVSHA